MMSLVVVAPAAVWPSVISINRLLGYEAGEGVPLTEDGVTVTHRGLHAWATPEFVAIAKGEAAVQVPGMSEQQVLDFLSILTASSRPNDALPFAHFADVLASLSLERVEEEEQ